MTAPVNKPISEENLNRFKEYFLSKNGSWGHLHLVLGNQNIKDNHVRAAKESALMANDMEAHILCDILLTLSKSQRMKISKQAVLW